MVNTLKSRIVNLVNQSQKHPIIIVYSGVSTIGRNSYIVLHKKRAFLIDFGIGFPDIDIFNIKGIIPDLRVMQALKPYLKGILLTHAHMDHVGGLPYLLQNVDLLNVPIIGSRFTIEFIRGKLKEVKLHNKIKTHIIRSGESIKLGGVNVSYAHVTHSIPHSMMVGIDTQYGKIVYTGDYKFDATPIAERPSDTHIIEKWADKGILAALLDSTNAYEKGHSKSETSIMASLEEIMLQAKGRVIIGMFSSLVSRMIAVIEIAKRLGKKVAFTGRSMEQNIKIARKIGYLVADRDVIIPIEHAKKYSDKKLIILSTGSQGEYQAGLMKMARGKHDHIKLKSTDTVILSSSVIPTNVISVQELMDLLAHTGATVINSKIMNVHVSGHAYQEELVQMAYLLNARYFIPVHGYPAFLFQHKKVLVDSGLPASRIWVPTEGSIFTFPQGKLHVRKKLSVYPHNILGGSVLPQNDTIFTERRQLASSGVITVVIDSHNRKVHVSHVGVVPKALKKEVTTKVVDEVRPLVKKSKNLIAGSAKQRQQVQDLVYKRINTLMSKEFKVSPVVSVRIV